MRGCERQEAGVTPAQLMEEGFRGGWAREHPDKAVPEEVIRLFAQWAAKPPKPYQPEPTRATTRTTRPEAGTGDDIDPFAEDFHATPRRMDPAQVTLAEEEVRARLAAAAAKRAEQDGTGPAGQFFATMEAEA